MGFMSRGRTVFAVVALASFALAPAPVRADNGPVIVIPSRPGIPVIINGRDASYAVVEGDWGLFRPGAVPVTVTGGSPVLPNEVYRRRNSYIPKYGRAPERGRYEVEPPADRALPEPAESFSREWSTSSDTAAPVTITDPATFPNYMNGGINGALINNNSNNSNNRNSGNTNTNSNNSQNTNYNNSSINNNNTNSNNTNTTTTTTNTNSNNTNTSNTNSNNTSNANSNNNSSRNTIGSYNNSRRHRYH
jgi:hypothetical protein